MESPTEPGASNLRRSVDDVVDDLTRIVEGCRTDRSYRGVFPSMYRAVTVTMSEGLERDFFDDPGRVARLVVVFADRYIDAYDGWQAGRRVTRSWEQAFRFAEERRGSILQHLMLGMNAHINLDLGIAASEVTSAAELEALHGDFGRVNVILFAMVDQCQHGLNVVSPWMRRFDRLGLGFDEAALRLGIRAARSLAWELTERLVRSSPEERPSVIDRRDEETRDLGHVLCHRFSLLNVVNRVVAGRESTDLGRVLDAVGSPRIDLAALRPE